MVMNPIIKKDQKVTIFFHNNLQVSGPPLDPYASTPGRTSPKNLAAFSTGFPAPKSRPIQASPTAQPTVGCTNSNPAGRSRGSTWQVQLATDFVVFLRGGGVQGEGVTGEPYGFLGKIGEL